MNGLDHSVVPAHRTAGGMRSHRSAREGDVPVSATNITPRSRSRSASRSGRAASPSEIDASQSESDAPLSERGSPLYRRSAWGPQSPRR
jgi:hypothetical protein